MGRCNSVVSVAPYGAGANATAKEATPVAVAFALPSWGWAKPGQAILWFRLLPPTSCVWKGCNSVVSVAPAYVRRWSNCSRLVVSGNSRIRRHLLPLPGGACVCEQVATCENSLVLHTPPRHNSKTHEQTKRVLRLRLTLLLRFLLAFGRSGAAGARRAERHNLQVVVGQVALGGALHRDARG